MSALNVFIEAGKAAHIITDGAGDMNGKIFCYANKAFAVPHLSLAAGVRGTTAMLATLQLLVASFESFVDLKANLGRHLKEAFGNGADDAFDLALAGVAHGNPFGFFISSEPHPGTTPFTFIPINGGVITPVLDPNLLGGLIETTAEGVDQFAVAVVSAQRDLGTPVIGAFVQVTSVTSEGVTQRVVHRWPEDRVTR